MTETPSTSTKGAPRSHGLGRRLTLIMAAIIAICIASSIFTGITRNAQTARADYLAQTALKTEMFASTLGGAVRFGNVEVISASLASLAERSDGTFEGARVLNGAGEIVYAVGGEGIAGFDTLTVADAEARTEEGFAPVEVVFGQSGESVGSVIIKWSLAGINERIMNTTLVMVLAGSAMALICLAGIYILMQRMLIAPVKRLDMAMTRMQEGDLDVDIAGANRNDEIGALARKADAFRRELKSAKETKAFADAAQQSMLEDRQSMLDQLDQEFGRVTAAVAEGRFSERVECSFEDSAFTRLADGLNSVCDRISEFLSDLDSSVAALSRGDLSDGLSSQYQGRFAEVSGGVNSTLQTLSSVVARLQEAGQEIHANAERLSEGANNLARRTESQAASLEETAATMEELSSTISTNAESAKSSQRAAQEAQERASQGQEVVVSAIAAMEDIEQSSTKVSDIISVIDSIAFQTNLLALNAAVEAARAGDAGKGFAVVASEVRTLAQRCSDAARDITNLITESQSKVNGGAELVRRTGDTLSEIHDAIARVSQTASEIGDATQEQARGISGLSGSISQLDSVTQQNAALAEESASAAQMLKVNTDALADQIGFFGGTSQDDRVSDVA